jgi:Uncharacterized conserved protein (COG2071)
MEDGAKRGPVLTRQRRFVNKTFLTAEWRHLVMLNYPVERALLDPLVPRGLELDQFNSVAYVSVVGLKTRVFGISFPFHRNFEEVNLRFYVRHWGYTARGGRCTQYQVEHPRWRVWRATASQFEADVASLYGAEFVAPLSTPSASAFIAEGSPVIVWRGSSLASTTVAAE